MDSSGRGFASSELEIRAIRQRRLDGIARSAMTRVLDAVAARKPTIHPRHLVTWYIFQSDRDLDMARENGPAAELDSLTRTALIDGSYPKKGAQVMHVAFTSEEDVERKSGGDHFADFK